MGAATEAHKPAVAVSIARSTGIKYETRYVDDFFVFCPSLVLLFPFPLRISGPM